MSETKPVEVGQVYRERDGRFIRYVKVDSFTAKNGEPAAWCLPCDLNGTLLRRGRGTRIKRENLQKRFELIR